ncbi:MAG: hypothetical protein AB8B69_03905 [Chitinophagales bacterium]
MKELLQTFGYTLAIGIVVFFGVMIISRSSTGFMDRWKSDPDRIKQLEREADALIDKMDNSVNKTKRFVDRVKGTETPRTTTPTPRPTTPSPSPVEEDTEEEHYQNTVEDTPEVIEEPPTDEVLVVDKPEEYVNNTPPPQNTRSAAVEDDDKTYQIQLGVVSKKNAKISNFKIVSGLGEVYEESINNKTSRILLGDFDGKRAARLVLDEVKYRGLKDAFLVEIKPSYPATSFTADTTEPIPTSNVNDIGNYVVRLGVFSEPPTSKLTRLSEIGKIYLQAHATNPNLNVVSLGVFTSRSEAENALAAAKKQSFNDAFIATADNQLVDANAGQGFYYLPDEEKKAKPSNACVEQYIIQLSAAKRPNLGDFKALLNMGNLFTEYDPHKDVSKVFVGPFEEKATANKALQTVKAKGFNQAFVVDRTKY